MRSHEALLHVTASGRRVAASGRRVADTGRRVADSCHRILRVAARSTVTVGWLLAASATMAASPDPTSPALGDPRSSGEGPGLVGDPMLAIAIVVGIALVSLVATLLYVRATGGRRDG